MPRSAILKELEDHGILPTPQRLKVAAILLQKPQHLSVEQIIDRLRSRGSSMCKATVYNSLKLFREKGLVKELIVDAERRFYDTTTQHHHHFYNIDTGELSDIADGDIRLCDLPELPEGTSIDSVELVIKVRGG